MQCGSVPIEKLTGQRLKYVWRSIDDAVEVHGRGEHLFRHIRNKDKAQPRTY